MYFCNNLRSDCNYIQAVDSNLNTIINTTVLTNINSNNSNVSNYIQAVDSNLNTIINTKDSNISNYAYNIDNKLVGIINTKDSNISNYALGIDNKLSGFVNANDSNISNYLLSTSNIISLRINNLTTDNINKGVNNKFIVNNYHNDILNIAGKFNIFSNGNFVDIVNIYEDNINSNTILKILQNGRVGIGKSQPSEKLDVSGNINITGNYMVNNEIFKTSQWTTKNDSIYFTIISFIQILMNIFIFLAHN